MQHRKQIGNKGMILKVMSLAVVTLAVCGQLSVSRADANTLLPGTHILLNGGPGVSGGASLLFSTNVAWSGPRSSGELISSVYSNSVNNPYGGLTFTYQLFLDASSTSGEGTLALSSFAGYTNIDATYTISSPGQPPDYVNRSQQATDGGSDVNFVYFVEIVPGVNTPILNVDTGAQTWFLTTASVIDSIAVPNITTIGPIPLEIIPTPEPSTMGLMTTGGLMALAYVRRLKNSGK